MHYRNGREAKNGDTVIMVPVGGGIPVAGILYGAVAGNDCCDGRIAHMSYSDTYANLKECLHVDDVANAKVESFSPITAFVDPKQ